MIENLSMMFATFAMVFLISIQQQNVTHGHKLLAFLTSHVIAVAQVATTVLIVNAGWWSIPWVGFGGGVGVVCGMTFFKKFVKRA